MPSLSPSLRVRFWDAAHLLLWVAAAIYACMAEGPGTLPFALDNQVYFFIAERVAAGVPPHVSQFDPKNALSAMLTAAAMLVGRGFGVDDVVAARSVSIVAVVSAVVLAWLLARRSFGSRLAASAAAASPLCFYLLVHLGAMGSRPKVFLVPLILASLLAIDLRRWAWAGFLSAASFLVWQPSLLVPAAAFLAAAVSSERRKATVAVVAASTATIAAYELYFLWHGALGEQLWQSLVFPAIYTKPPRALGSVLWSIFEMNGAFPKAQIAMGALGLAFLASWVCCLRGPRWVFSESQKYPMLFATTLYAHGALFFSVSDYQGRPDRLFLVPAAAVAGAALIAALLRGLVWLASRQGVDVARWRSSVGFGVASLVLSLGVAQAAATMPRRPFYRVDLDGQRAMATQVLAWKEEGLKVWAVGCPHLLAFAHLSNHNYFGYFPFRVRLHLTQLAKSQGGMFDIRSEEGEMPDILLLSRFKFLALERWMAGRFNQEGNADFSRDGIRVFRRLDGVGPAPQWTAEGGNPKS